MTWVFAALALLVIVGTGLALAGLWRPEGLPQGRPDVDAPQGDGSTRFSVVLRGYRMDQVDAEIERLRAALAQQSMDRPPEADQQQATEVGQGSSTMPGSPGPVVSAAPGWVAAEDRPTGHGRVPGDRPDPGEVKS